MGLPVTIKVNFRGNVKRFLAQDLDKLEWESVETWIKASFGINHFQVKYFDEDNEEICINSQDEYEEAIKSAEKQGNQLHMNVYKMKGQACGGPLKTEVKELKGELRPAPPYPSRVKTVDKGTQVTPERENVIVKDSKESKPEDEPPPMWFRSYMEKFKDEVVREVVERMCSDFSGQCCTHKSSDVLQEASGASGGVMGPKPGPSTSNGSLGYTPNCSSCNKPTSEGAYKCRVCPSCILCEVCRHDHDPSHSLMRTKTPLSIPEHGPSGELRGPGASHTSLVPTMAALFLDENLPDGTRLEPGTKFIKYWKMKNSGTISWTPETKLVFMWGNLGLASEDRREVPVPLLLPGQVGVVSVAFVAPVMEGMYTSHWRLAHCGCQFGPRVWCSIVVDSGSGRSALWQQSKPPREEVKAAVRSKDGVFGLPVDLPHEDFYFPSVDLLTAQDLLSFELLDINIVQELEKVPNNTPVDLTPCISPLPHDALLFEKSIMSQMKAEAEAARARRSPEGKMKPQEVSESTTQEEEKEEEISGAQFLCETIIRSLTLEEAPDHRPLRRAQHGRHKTLAVSKSFQSVAETEKELEASEEVEVSPLPVTTGLHDITPKEQETGQAPLPESEAENLHVSPPCDGEDKGALHANQSMRGSQEEGGAREDWDEVSSQTSSVSSGDDYIIVLPDCFDTSRPLGESMYSSAMSQPDAIAALTVTREEEEACEGCDFEPCREAAQTERSEDTEELPSNARSPAASPTHSSVNQMLCASQTLDTVTLTPEVVAPPPQPLPALYSPRSEALYLAEDPVSPACEPCDQPQVHLKLPSSLSRSSGSASSAFETYNPRLSNALQPRGQGGITEGFVKGALSVAASAYKALFTGPNCPVQRGIDPATRQDPSMMAMLLEMGFRDQRLNEKLLRKHSYSLQHAVNDLVQMSEENQNQAVDALH
ncbi:NBR1 autophagy cargo receptor a isoform X2 [Oryzias melastigma]|uniref:NBR1 autophagy cargo receptor a isoform X2 n=1 Tax=Oryzias melastigma TaxID=30732 RepID=UPI000CF7E3B9|nr:NBR1 autophagy cargo receptor a isoform X2 [Oryzias melastigma]